jgi:hypothetical protein
MTKISVFRAPDKNGRDSVALLLSQDAMVVLEDGDPYPGVALYPPQAREIAYRLLLFAQEIENGRMANQPSNQGRMPPPPLFGDA